MMFNKLFLLSAVLFLMSLITIVAYKSSFYSSELSLEEYKKTILELLRSKYPEADKISIVKVEKLPNTYKIIARVTFNYNSCWPKRYHLEFLYPEYHLEEIEPLFITHDPDFCRDACKILFEEEAILASTKVPAVKKICNAANVSVAYNGSWIVHWLGKENITVVLDVDGSIKKVSYN